MTINVEQFVYAAAAIKNKKGYQIVAKSTGITKDILEKLEPYLYPIGMDPNTFTESRSLVVFDNDSVAYTITKNIGTGYDGRENSIYSHVFVFSAKDFEKHGYDSRILNTLYVEDKTLKGILPTMAIDLSSPQYPIIPNVVHDVLEDILSALFKNQKVAVLLESAELPQEILSLMPESLRLVSFSTLVYEPKKQPNYQFILMPKSNKSKIPDDFKIIDPEKTVERQVKTEFEKNIYYYTQLFMLKKFDTLEQIQNSFEKLPGDDYQSKLKLICNYYQYTDSKNIVEQAFYVEKILESLENFNRDTFLYYLRKILPSLDWKKKLEGEIQLGITPRLELIFELIFSPEKSYIDACRAFLKKCENKRDNV